MTREEVRPADAEDYDRIAAVVDAWWERDVLAGLPRLFLDHFHESSLVAEDDGKLAGFLIGFVSPSRPDEAYVHYVAVAPNRRSSGLARRLYDSFAGHARSAGCTVLHAITSPGNDASIAFHRRMGFDVSDPVPDYNGPTRDAVVFTRRLPD